MHSTHFEIHWLFHFWNKREFWLLSRYLDPFSPPDGRPYGSLKWVPDSIVLQNLHERHVMNDWIEFLKRNSKQFVRIEYAWAKPNQQQTCTFINLNIIHVVAHLQNFHLFKKKNKYIKSSMWFLFNAFPNFSAIHHFEKCHFSLVIGVHFEDWKLLAIFL